MLYMVLQLPLGIIYFTVMVTALSLSAATIAMPFVQMLDQRADHPRLPVRLLHRAVGDAAVRDRRACSASS